MSTPEGIPSTPSRNPSPQDIHPEEPPRGRTIRSENASDPRPRPASPPRPASCSGPRARESRRRRDSCDAQWPRSRPTAPSTTTDSCTARADERPRPAAKQPRAASRDRARRDESSDPRTRCAAAPIAVVGAIAGQRCRCPRAARATRPRRRRATGSSPRPPLRSRSSSGRRSPATAARTRIGHSRAMVRGLVARIASTTIELVGPGHAIQARAHDAPPRQGDHDDREAASGHRVGSEVDGSAADPSRRRPPRGIRDPRQRAHRLVRALSVRCPARTGRCARPTSGRRAHAGRAERRGQVQRAGVGRDDDARAAEQRQQLVEVRRGCQRDARPGASLADDRGPIRTRSVPR